VALVDVFEQIIYRNQLPSDKCLPLLTATMSSNCYVSKHGLSCQTGNTVGLPVGIVRVRTKGHGVCLFVCFYEPTRATTTDGSTGNKNGGRFLAQAVSRRLPTAAARVRAHVKSRGSVVDRAALGPVFYEYLGLSC
jgi:hypothetical protein